MPTLTVREIAESLKAEVLGDPGTRITGIAGIKEAQAGDITFLENRRYSPMLESTVASAVIVGKDIALKERPKANAKGGVKAFLVAENPSLAFSQVVSLLYPVKIRHPQGIHPTAIISKSAQLGKNAAIGAYALIGENVRIGDNTIIYGNCFIGDEVSIGKDSLIYPLVTVRERVQIGSRVILYSGCVVGSDGFGYTLINGMREKIPQVGTVVIEDDVEIGANTTIDRARFDKTIIGQGTKIDNLVQIAHNIRIGKNCIIVAQAGISGSTIIEDNVIIAGQAGLVGHITVGEGSTVAAQAGVIKSVPKGIKVSGYPARPHEQAMRIYALSQRLPELRRTLETLEKRVGELESGLKARKSKK